MKGKRQVGMLVLLIFAASIGGRAASAGVVYVSTLDGDSSLTFSSGSGWKACPTFLPP